MNNDVGISANERALAPELTTQVAESILRALAGAADSERLVSAGLSKRQSTHENGRLPTETKLRWAEARYRTLIEQMPVVTFLAALEGGSNDLYVSPQIERLLGFSQKEWLENPILWYVQLHSDDRERWHLEFAQTCASGEPFRSEYRFLTRDGRVVWVHGEAQVVRDEAGHPLFLQGVAYDITEKKKAEEVLLRLNAELEGRVRERTADLERANATLTRQAEELGRSNADLEQFAYIASHDLQEPLRMVSSFTQLLARRYRGKLGDDADDFIAYVVDGAARMQRLINDLLSYSRAGRSGRPLALVDLTTVFANACANLSKAIEESGAEITADSLPTVRAEGSQVLQLIQNLIGNAIKFCKRDQPPRIHFGVDRRESDWLFSIRDNGIGIEAQYAERIFKVFQRLHNRQDYPGTGIGLAICKKVVERRGGQIWLESTPGQGSTFFFTFPTALEGDTDG